VTHHSYEARVTVSEAGGIAVASLTHEMLIHSPPLRYWVEEERANLRRRDQIARAAADWNDSGRNSDYLYRGRMLDRAEQLRRSDPSILGKTSNVFIRAGLMRRLRLRILTVLGAILILGVLLYGWLR
jgi:hypothetical protein